MSADIFSPVSGSDLPSYEEENLEAEEVRNDDYEHVSGGDSPVFAEYQVNYESVFSEEDADSLLEMVQAIHTNTETLSAGITQLNASVSVVVSVVIILIAWKVTTLIYKLFDMFF